LYQQGIHTPFVVYDFLEPGSVLEIPEFDSMMDYIEWLQREKRGKIWADEAKGQRLHNYHIVLIRLAKNFKIEELVDN
jgi:hypothetical protein